MVDKLLTNCLSVFDHFVGLALKRLKIWENHHALSISDEFPLGHSKILKFAKYSNTYKFKKVSAKQSTKSYHLQRL